VRVALEPWFVPRPIPALRGAVGPEELYGSPAVPQTSAAGRAPPITLQLGHQIPLAGDMFFALGNMALGQSKMVKQDLSIHGG
jgi:hypothetical protein